jgi:hypothetical protein
MTMREVAALISEDLNGIRRERCDGRYAVDQMESILRGN